jgi:hypothetical protein
MFYKKKCISTFEENYWKNLEKQKKKKCYPIFDVTSETKFPKTKKVPQIMYQTKRNVSSHLFYINVVQVTIYHQGVEITI